MTASVLNVYKTIEGKILYFIIKYVFISQMAFRDATNFCEGRHLFQHGQHLKDVSNHLFGDIRCFSPYSHAASNYPIFCSLFHITTGS